MLTQYFTKSLCRGVAVAVLVLSLCACRKFVSIDPPTHSMVQETVFKDARTSAAALRQTYFLIAGSNYGTSSTSTSLLNALYPDEYRLTTSHIGLNMIYSNAPDAVESIFTVFWSNAYSDIYRANVIIEGLEAYGASMEKSIKDHMTGEAKFLRAYVYFQLVNMYGDVPLILSTDYEKNRLLARTAQELVYEQIVKDLTEAKALMKSDYLDWDNIKVSTTRLRATKEVAAALLARVYLYRREWTKAEKEATEVISASAVYALESVPADAFNVASRETLLAFDDQGGRRPRAAAAYVLTSNPNNSSFANAIGVISDTLLSSFEAGDNRRRDWVGVFATGGNSYHFANKYKGISTLTQYDCAMRFAEVYLVRAEARLEQGLSDLAVDDLNVIRNRARAEVTLAVTDPLPVLPYTLTEEEIRKAMEKERFTELFIEGHRWFDLKRWKGLSNPAISRADEVMPAIAIKKGTSWQPHLKLLPIPQKQLELNVNLEQNKDY